MNKVNKEVGPALLVWESWKYKSSKGLRVGRPDEARQSVDASEPRRKGSECNESGVNRLRFAQNEAKGDLTGCPLGK